MVKKLEWIEMAQLATILFPVEGKGRREKGEIHGRERLGDLLKYYPRK
jgi:hypothetical protein